eukprot:5511347-Pleurochrysis_carterae.AAC.1
MTATSFLSPARIAVLAIYTRRQRCGLRSLSSMSFCTYPLTIRPAARARRWVPRVRRKALLGLLPCVHIVVTFNYMHLSAAHLEELIIQHGLLERSDHEMLKRDNRTAKRIKSDLLLWGGSSDPDKQIEVQSEFREVLDFEGRVVEYALVESERRRTAGQGKQFARLMLGRKLLPAERLKNRPAESAVKAELVKLKKEKTAFARVIMREHLSALQAFRSAAEV